MDIYDRSNWPNHDANPLVIMLRRGDEWYSNEEIVAALGLTERRALMSNQTSFARTLVDGDSALVGRRRLTPSLRISNAHGGSQRVFSRRAVILAAMRTNTVNAAAFRDWLAGYVAAQFETEEAVSVL